MLKITGSIRKMQSRIDAADRLIQVIHLEIFGEFASVHGMMNKPLESTLEELTLKDRIS